MCFLNARIQMVLGDSRVPGDRGDVTKDNYNLPCDCLPSLAEKDGRPEPPGERYSVFRASNHSRFAGDLPRNCTFAESDWRILASFWHPIAFAHEVEDTPLKARLFGILDEHLWFGETAKDDWIVPGAHPTIADIACFPYVALSEEGGISRQDYPAIRRRCDRVKRIPGFVGMSGIFAT